MCIRDRWGSMWTRSQTIQENTWQQRQAARVGIGHTRRTSTQLHDQGVDRTHWNLHWVWVLISYQLVQWRVTDGSVGWLKFTYCTIIIYQTNRGGISEIISRVLMARVFTRLMNSIIVLSIDYWLWKINVYKQNFEIYRFL